MRIEDEHTDVLQNIEFVVAQHFRARPEMTDYDVTRVYEALIDVYAGENTGRQPQPWKPTLLPELPYLGVASGRPPSTGIVAPVVGVWRVAKKRTAFATCLPVTADFSRFRLR